VFQESQSDIVVMDIPGQAQHLSNSPLNLFGLCTGIEPKKHEKTQLKPFECCAEINDQSRIARSHGPAHEKCELAQQS
jgi:hypothetical protein